jgi:hypothetical protein
MQAATDRADRQRGGRWGRNACSCIACGGVRMGCVGSYRCALLASLRDRLSGHRASTADERGRAASRCFSRRSIPSTPHWILRLRHGFVRTDPRTGCHRRSVVAWGCMVIGICGPAPCMRAMTDVHVSWCRAEVRTLRRAGLSVCAGLKPVCSTMHRVCVGVDLVRARVARCRVRACRSLAVVILREVTRPRAVGAPRAREREETERGAQRTAHSAQRRRYKDNPCTE